MHIFSGTPGHFSHPNQQRRSTCDYISQLADSQLRLKTNTSLLYMQLHVFVLQEVIFIFQKIYINWCSEPTHLCIYSLIPCSLYLWIIEIDPWKLDLKHEYKYLNWLLKCDFFFFSFTILSSSAVYWDCGTVSILKTNRPLQFWNSFSWTTGIFFFSWTWILS